MPLVSRDTHLSEPSRGRPGDRGPGARPAPAPRTPRATGSIPTARPPHQHREAPDVPSRSDLPRKNAAAAQQKPLPRTGTGTANRGAGHAPVPGRRGSCRCRGCPAAATTPRRRPARQPAQRTTPARSQKTAPAHRRHRSPKPAGHTPPRPTSRVPGPRRPNPPQR
jgi:hypothetical protein